MSSVNNNVTGNDNDNGNSTDIDDNDYYNVNDDVFAVSNFSDPFYSAFKKLSQL